MPKMARTRALQVQMDHPWRVLVYPASGTHFSLAQLLCAISLQRPPSAAVARAGVGQSMTDLVLPFDQIVQGPETKFIARTVGMSQPFLTESVKARQSHGIHGVPNRKPTTNPLGISCMGMMQCNSRVCGVFRSQSPASLRKEQGTDSQKETALQILLQYPHQLGWMPCQ